VSRPIKCPICKKQGNWLEGQFSPFCSHRCKLIDLGKWFSEENKVSEPLKPEHFVNFEELPPGKHLDQIEES
jgi:endogenous inhibitor of DNA gyrase (YacG/DUF329 family)